MRSSKLGRPPSLRVRQLVLHAAGILLTVGLVAVVFAAMSHGAAGHRLQELAEGVASRLSFDSTGRPSNINLPPDFQWLYDDLAGDIEFRVVDADGTVVLADQRGDRSLFPPGLGIDSIKGAQWVEIDGHIVYIAASPVEHAGTLYYAQAASSERLASLAGIVLSKRFGLGLILTVLISIPVLGALILVTSGRLLRPLDNASVAAARIGPRNLAARLSVDGVPREAMPLVVALNAALDRLEKGYRAQQDFLATAAHELKTPLALLRGQIELEGITDRATLLNDIDVMARQVQQLLYLAEVSEPQNYSFTLLNPAEVVANVIDFLSRLAKRNEVRLELQPPSPPIDWRADQGALFTLLKNLVENAIQHSPAGGTVTIAVDPNGLSVKDQGSGIASEHIPHLFKRFWRGPREADRGGAGLGLSICHEIAAAHHWTLQATNTSPGASFRLDIRSPIGSNPDAAQWSDAIADLGSNLLSADAS